MIERFTPDLRASIAQMAIYCRQQGSNGNINVLDMVQSLRRVGHHLIGEEEFSRWESWVAPPHIVINRAITGRRPG